MTHSFVCYGGSGSTFLSRRLARRHVVHTRPETYWLPWYFPRQSKSATDFDQQLSVDGYSDFPTKSSIAGFRRRSGFALDPTKSIDDNLVDYWKHMQASPGLVSMFSRAPMLGFFARHNFVKNVVFVVRHPVHQYLSLTKPNRHFEFVEASGGVNASASIAFWIREWGSFVRDALSSNACIIRYERAQSDASSADAFVADVFRKWDGSKRNHTGLDSVFEEQLREGVRDEYKEVYGAEWRL